MPGAPLVCLQGICKRFRGADRPPALDGVSLDVAEGRIHGVIGRSGAGKSTLIRCVNLLERPDGGRVLVGGQDMMALGGAALAEARRGIGMVFQHFNLLSARTVADNVALPLEIAGVAGAERRARVADLLGLVGLTDRAGAYPAALSGGQKQRLAIARALLKETSVLILDEATSSLDAESERVIQDALAGLYQRRSGVTTVIIAHRLSTVQGADKIFVLEHGSLVESGTHRELLGQRGLYRRLYDLQWSGGLESAAD